MVKTTCCVVAFDHRLELRTDAPGKNVAASIRRLAQSSNANLQAVDAPIKALDVDAKKAAGCSLAVIRAS